MGGGQEGREERRVLDVLGARRRGAGAVKPFLESKICNHSYNSYAPPPLLKTRQYNSTSPHRPTFTNISYIVTYSVLPERRAPRPSPPRRLYHAERLRVYIPLQVVSSRPPDRCLAPPPRRPPLDGLGGGVELVHLLGASDDLLEVVNPQYLNVAFPLDGHGTLAGGKVPESAVSLP